MKFVTLKVIASLTDSTLVNCAFNQFKKKDCITNKINPSLSDIFVGNFCTSNC